MKRFFVGTVASILLAGSISLPAAAQARDHGPRSGSPPAHNSQEHRNNRSGELAGARGDRALQSYAPRRNLSHRPQRSHGDRHFTPPRAYAHNRFEHRRFEHRRFARQWRRGERLGHDTRRYRDIDYRDYRLQPPPRGYRWVQDDNGDLIMAALAGGLIAAIIAAN